MQSTPESDIWIVRAMLLLAAGLNLTFRFWPDVILRVLYYGRKSAKDMPEWYMKFMRMLTPIVAIVTLLILLISFWHPEILP